MMQAHVLPYLQPPCLQSLKIVDAKRCQLLIHLQRQQNLRTYNSLIALKQTICTNQSILVSDTVRQQTIGRCQLVMHHACRAHVAENSRKSLQAGD
jgi:hypothetical protein